jgi:predicted SnoaL-like aldol condensation-catalyzing enzyme
VSRARQNIDNAIEFLTLGLHERRPEEAIEKYVGEEYIQHNSRVATGKQGFIDMVHEVFDPMPRGPGPALKKAIGDDTHAWLLWHTPGEPGGALVEIFRFDENGKIVEHWDVHAPLADPADYKHDNGPF